MVGLAINGQTHIKDININKAIFYHFIMTFLFGLGYLLSINLIKDKKHTTAVQYLTLDKTFFYLAFALTTFGLFTSILTVNTIYPIKQYILHLFDYGQHKELLVDIKYKSNTSGLSGILKGSTERVELHYKLCRILWRSHIQSITANQIFVIPDVAHTGTDM
jgi:hypothetical protein